VDIELFDLTPTDDDLGALYDVAVSKSYIGGEQVKLLEEEIAAYLGVRHAITCANGTDALTLMLRAVYPYPVGAHEQIDTTAYTFGATVEAIINAGHWPKFRDINPDTYNVDWWCGAALVVHLFGNVCKDMDSGDFEDACQAFGAENGAGRKAGSLGRAAAFSFFRHDAQVPPRGRGRELTTGRDAGCCAARETEEDRP
jgi:dTDP-4-amino-4,6-dideoxygalactose transaminase